MIMPGRMNDCGPSRNEVGSARCRSNPVGPPPPKPCPEPANDRGYWEAAEEEELGTGILRSNIASPPAPFLRSSFLTPEPAAAACGSGLAREALLPPPSRARRASRARFLHLIV